MPYRDRLAFIGPPWIRRVTRIRFLEETVLLIAGASWEIRGKFHRIRARIIAYLSDCW
jgi:hypothetical protein